MKKTTSRVHKAMRETVDVDGLADKIFGKYLKFIQTKATSPGPHINVPVTVIENPSPEIPKSTPEEDNGLNSMPTDLGSIMDPNENRDFMRGAPAPASSRAGAQ